jgi:hypothetical protein
MRTIEQRKIEITRCDFCKEETSQGSQCLLCHRDLCFKEGGSAHAAYDLDLYRYDDRVGRVGQICKECAETDARGTVRSFLDGIIEG